MMQTREIPDDFMRRMPEPSAYYAARIRGLTEADAHGWASGLCPLDRFPRGHRVRVDFKTGNFSCATCGRGDLLLFHMLLTRKRFKACLLELIGDSYDD